ncbi:HSPB1-associated protein 1 homolog [Myxocyprinus asiaticus]|uniref:HSPB1-associated protein 1 homolog n=1 Tax=Myxocyprinus asiaticus TaxID=70543 RepID=UPI002223C412|nr:HSPB1-associated protein 1 homolog [Myxocyprinus asiaticus]
MIWISTHGVNTPCHLDSYGCNLAVQIQGRLPCRLEVISSKAATLPNSVHHSRNEGASVDFQPLRISCLPIITLVLFVPRHWWHYVESVDPVTISVISKIEMDMDDEARVGEALTKTIVCALKSAPSLDNDDHWLSPTE